MATRVYLTGNKQPENWTFNFVNSRRARDKIRVELTTELTQLITVHGENVGHLQESGKLHLQLIYQSLAAGRTNKVRSKRIKCLC